MTRITLAVLHHEVSPNCEPRLSRPVHVPLVVISTATYQKSRHPDARTESSQRMTREHYEPQELCLSCQNISCAPTSHSNIQTSRQKLKLTRGSHWLSSEVEIDTRFTLITFETDYHRLQSRGLLLMSILFPISYHTCVIIRLRK